MILIVLGMDKILFGQLLFTGAQNKHWTRIALTLAGQSFRPRRQLAHPHRARVVTLRITITATIASQKLKLDHTHKKVPEN
jgi:hypothetical protein